MRIEYKPEYKLKIKYPRLPLKFESGDTVYYNSLSKAYVRKESPHYVVDVNEVENYPDFWEKMGQRQPLMVTADGMYVYDGWVVTTVNKLTLEKQANQPVTTELANNTNFVVFVNKGKADKYIEENKLKPLLTTEDGVDKYLGDGYIRVHKDGIKQFNTNIPKYNWVDNITKEENEIWGIKAFHHEKNADEYIWRNMKSLSYNEVMDIIKVELYKSDMDRRLKIIAKGVWKE